jgi:hypothetical protein
MMLDSVAVSDQDLRMPHFIPDPRQDEPTVEELSRWSGCSNPGNASIGGLWLRSVREIYFEWLPRCVDDDDLHAAVLFASEPAVESLLWAVFADVEAWRIDLDVLHGYSEDMGSNARDALALIASSLVDHFEQERKTIEDLERGL